MLPAVVAACSRVPLALRALFRCGLDRPEDSLLRLFDAPADESPESRERADCFPSLASAEGGLHTLHAT
jgi:hypothetical protein